MTAIAITGMGLTGVLRTTWVQDNLAHILDYSQAGETSGTWTGLACPGHGLALGADVDNAVLLHLVAGNEVADLTWEAPDELTMSAGQQTPEMGQWIKDLAADHHTFAETLAERQSLTVPSEDPDYGDLGQAFPPWPGPARDAILQPPKPEIRPSPQVLQRAADRDADPEAAD